MKKNSKKIYVILSIILFAIGIGFTAWIIVDLCHGERVNASMYATVICDVCIGSGLLAAGLKKENSNSSEDNTTENNVTCVNQ